jgi:hypothetical protein
MAAGWLAMASAIVAIPWLILILSLREKQGLAVKFTEAAMLLVGTALVVFLLLMLKRLINTRYGFDLADRPIRFLVKANIVSSMASLAGLAFPRLESVLGVFGAVMIAAVGIGQIFLGLRLLRLPADLQGLQKPYCYLNIATGCFLASVYLFPVGILTGSIADVMLGTIFFQTAASWESSDS